MRGTQHLETLLETELSADMLQEALLELLADTSVPSDAELPIRGRPLELERRVAPCFIKGTDYGTRASTSVIIEPQRIQFAEQLYEVDGHRGKRSDLQLTLTR